MCDVLLCHRKRQYEKKTEKAFSLPSNCEGFLWETCLRQVLFLPVTPFASTLLHEELLNSPSLGKKAGWTFYRGQEAYGFCLEVVCGMQSPLKGETEVLGQFKNFFAKIPLPSTPFEVALRQFCTEILADGRFLRKKYLYGLGSQSYGSIVRRWTKNYKQVHLIGSGQLAQSILPWICEGQRNLSLFCRNKIRAMHLAQYLQRKKPKWKGSLSVFGMESLSQKSLKGAFVIVAPVEDTFILSMINQQTDLILDLRGRSSLLKERQVENKVKVVSLGDMFSQVQSFEKTSRGKGSHCPS